jgi:16S rRNA (guanine(966)-N(2))-methyltransferase RsmD
MLQSRAGTLTGLPPGARWLDLFAGTGSVGLEALSRGVREAHFVEMDPVVVSKVLAHNIRACGFKGRAWTHTTKAEDFLRRAAELPRFAGGPFDFISVCPPYLLVSYPELFELLAASPLLHAGSVVFVEYPKQLAGQVVDQLGPLRRVRDRRYGRTWVALYAAAGGSEADEEEDGEGGGAAELDAADDPFLAM